MKHLLQGWRDFFLRYFKIFKSAWAVRRQLDPPARSADERAFLPAHLELTETPVSPTARWTMRILIGFFCVAPLWACLGKLDIVAVAPGKTVVDSRTKVVQTAETAVVRRILVRDGQAVKKASCWSNSMPPPPAPSSPRPATHWSTHGWPRFARQRWRPPLRPRSRRSSVPLGSARRARGQRAAIGQQSIRRIPGAPA